MKIGFIIVLYKNDRKTVDKLINNIKQLNLPDYKIYTVDNSNKNKGYAYGVNKGIKKALQESAQLLVICNTDIKINISKKNILEAYDYYDIWGFTMNQQGRTYYGGGLDKWRLSAKLITKKPLHRFFSVYFVCGSLMFIKRKVIDKIGLLDERYFMYYEDADYCLRAKKAGFKIGIDRDLSYVHFELSRLNKSKYNQLAKSRIRFFVKYSTFQQKIRELLRLPKTIYEIILRK